MHFIGVTSMSIYAIANDSLRPLGAGQSSLHFRFNGDDKGPTKCEKGSGEREERKCQRPSLSTLYLTVVLTIASLGFLYQKPELHLGTFSARCGA